MHLSIRSATIPLSLALLALPGAARPRQGTPINPVSAQGMFSNFAVAMTVEGVATPDPLLIRAPGINGGVPTEWTEVAFTAATQNHPDYSMTALTAHWTPANAPTPMFGGISTGGEVMPAVDSLGQVHMTTTNWFMLAVSVDANAEGEPGSVLALQRDGGRDASGDIISYYANGSTGINPALVDTVRLESSRDQLKLDQVLPVVSVPRRIRNFDYGAGIASIDALNRAGSMFPVRDCFYFTLMLDWLLQVPGFQLDGQPASASTVYVMTWDATATPPWSPPTIAFDHDLLFPPALEGQIEIDALSVDRGGVAVPANQPRRVILSLTPGSDFVGPFDQILVYQRYVMTQASALRTDPTLGPSQTFTHAMGFLAAGPGDPDNITGTCGGDPDELARLGSVVAFATDQPRLGLGTLGFSGIRTCPHGEAGGSGGSGDDESATDTLHLQITGMDYGAHMLGYVQLYTESRVPASGPPGPSSPWGLPIWIDPPSAQRNSIDLAGPVPCDGGGDPFRVSAQIVGVDFILTPTPSYTQFPQRETWVLTLNN